MRKSQSIRNGNEVVSDIFSIRSLEDCIRATRKYKEYLGSMRKKHPIQGEDFPSEAFCKYYEVYPDIELSWDMSAGIALDWLWGDTIIIDLKFTYDYRVNKASMSVKNGTGAIKELVRSIPEFKDTLERIQSAKTG